MAAQTFREKKRVLLINNNGDQFRWKKNMKNYIAVVRVCCTCKVVVFLIRKVYCTCKVVFFLLIRKNSVPHVESYFFWLIRSIVVVFFVLVIFALSFVLLDFIFSLRKL